MTDDGQGVVWFSGASAVSAPERSEVAREAPPPFSPLLFRSVGKLPRPVLHAAVVVVWSPPVLPMGGRDGMQWFVLATAGAAGKPFGLGHQLIQFWEHVPVPQAQPEFALAVSCRRVCGPSAACRRAGLRRSPAAPPRLSVSRVVDEVWVEHIHREEIHSDLNGFAMELFSQKFNLAVRL